MWSERWGPELIGLVFLPKRTPESSLFCAHTEEKPGVATGEGSRVHAVKQILAGSRGRCPWPYISQPAALWEIHSLSHLICSVFPRRSEVNICVGMYRRTNCWATHRPVTFVKAMGNFEDFTYLDVYLSVFILISKCLQYIMIARPVGDPYP